VDSKGREKGESDEKTNSFAVVCWHALDELELFELEPQGEGGCDGAGSGAVVGGLMAKRRQHRAGGHRERLLRRAGAYIGHYMDKQAEEMKRDLAGAKVERVGEGIKITFDSGILFDVDKATLKPQSMENLKNLAQILNKYEDTNILLEGHTDNTGSDEHNLQLSRLRAQAVSNYLASLQVDPSRFTVMGYGEEQPFASNETMDGRQANRRVNLAVMANDKLKKAAKEKAG
jgi:outer membrane protein OmpA-like peptidoglycan-associated protein